VTPGARQRARQVVVEALAPGPDCIRLERLDGPLTTTEADHIVHCPRCETEQALWTHVDDPMPSPGDGAGTPWIVAEVRRRRSAQSRPSPIREWGWPGLRRFATAALVMATVTIGYFAWDPEPALRKPPVTAPAYRTTQVQLSQPIGDIPTAPSTLHWIAVGGAARYDVAVLEIDRTVLWRASSSAPVIALPASVIARLLPGKTVLWRVRAIDAAGAIIGESSDQRFRVVARPSHDGA
jgi:hypothetical protein